MGWNRGYTIYEEQVVGLCDLEVLTPEVLDVVLNPFRGTDMDHGGERGLRTKSGLTADEVVVSVADPEYWAKFFRTREALIRDWGTSGINKLLKNFSMGENTVVDEWENLHDEFLDKWIEITETV